MIHVKFTRRLSNEQINEKIKEFERKYRMPVDEYYKRVVKGHEEELDEKDLLGEFEEWKHLSDVLAVKLKEPIVESFTKPLQFKGKMMKVEIEITQKELNALEDQTVCWNLCDEHKRMDVSETARFYFTQDCSKCRRINKRLRQSNLHLWRKLVDAYLKKGGKGNKKKAQGSGKIKRKARGTNWKK